MNVALAFRFQVRGKKNHRRKKKQSAGKHGQLTAQVAGRAGERRSGALGPHGEASQVPEQVAGRAGERRNGAHR
jgi:hypothetical protein